MQINEEYDGILFILTNQEIKKLRHSPKTITVSVSKGNVKMKYSFISENAWNNSVKRINKKLEEGVRSGKI